MRIWKHFNGLLFEMSNYNREEKVLAYWQGRYLFQLLVVDFIGMAFAVAVLFFVKFLLFKVIFLILDAVVMRLMIVALSEGVQYRGERAFFSNLKDEFKGLTFDYGKGIDEGVLSSQKVVDEYQVRECGNVIKGDGFVLEEDWFYNVNSIKSIAINDTVFRGVVCVYDVNIADELKGYIAIKGRVLAVNGNITSAITQEYKEKLIRLLKLFNAKEAKVVLAGGKLYVWIATRVKLFYQFNMVQNDKMGEFESRIRMLNFRL